MLPIALSAFLTLAPLPAAAGGPSASPASARVRPVSGHARALVTEAVARSSTVARLIETLQRYRVFVFVDTRVDPAIPTGETTLLTATDAGRYVHIVLNPALTVDRRIELLGHELQHALEIASADDVRDGASLRRHFAAIGRTLGLATRADQAYETDAARDIERQVRRDLGREVLTESPVLDK